MRYLIFLFFAVSMSLQAGSIQKWVDEDGNVHYGDAPPAAVKSQTVRVQSAPSNPGKPLPRLSDENGEGDGGGNAAAESDNATAEASPEQAAAKCERARSDLNIINTNTNIQLKQPDGTTRYLTGEEVDQYRRKAEADIAQYCS